MGANAHKVINIDPNIFIMCATVLNAMSRICLEIAIVMQDISYAIMPTGTRGKQTLESMIYH
jgi:hypothetical protein